MQDTLTVPTTTIVERPSEPVTRPDPELQRELWRFRFPWTKTAVGAPTNNGWLLIANRTDVPWVLHLGFHAIGTVDAQSERLIRVHAGLRFSARQWNAPVGAEYLTIDLAPGCTGVEVYDMSGNEGFYDLRLLREQPEADTLPAEAPKAQRRRRGKSPFNRSRR